MVAGELASAGGAIAGRAFAAVSADQWLRPGRRSDGASFTVETFARYFMHDPIHHLHDVTGIRRPMNFRGPDRLTGKGVTAKEDSAMTSEPLTTCLWFDDQAEEAARFYTSLFKDAGHGRHPSLHRSGAG